MAADEKVRAAISEYGDARERAGLLKGLAIAERIAVWCTATSDGKAIPANAVYQWAKTAIDRARDEAELPPVKWEE